MQKGLGLIQGLNRSELHGLSIIQGLNRGELHGLSIIQGLNRDELHGLSCDMDKVWGSYREEHAPFDRVRVITSKLDLGSLVSREE
jgi:hypothetical protein